MNILLASSEAVPFAKTGGLADVIGDLAAALRQLGATVKVILPLYRGIKSRFKLKPTGQSVSITIGGNPHRGTLFVHDDDTFFVDCPEFFDRRNLYGDAKGEYEDNAFRFIFFSRAVLELCRAAEFTPDVVHANDWQTALVPLYMKTLYSREFRDVPSLFTVHNLGYQGIFPAPAMTLTGLSQDFFSPKLLEYYGQVNLLKGGIVGADMVTTVSPGYARETLREEYGFGLDGLLRERSSNYMGILNGIDYSTWGPDADKLIPAGFSPEKLAGKHVCKKTLTKKGSFRDHNAPLVGMVGRLARQKGIDLFVKGAEDLFDLGVNVFLLGKGDELIQTALKKLARRHKGQFFLKLAHDDTLAHMVYAGSDMLLMPSRYEPCGLSQLIAMRYGTVPVAHAVGGLVNTVDDYDHLKSSGSGFLYRDHNYSAMVECLKRALSVYKSKTQWKALVQNCMKKDFSWKTSAVKYMDLYRKLSKQRVQ